ncbi:MAG: hypothetical protein ABI947_09120 [Chloroflexota bacterium]
MYRNWQLRSDLAAPEYFDPILRDVYQKVNIGRIIQKISGKNPLNTVMLSDNIKDIEADPDTDPTPDESGITDLYRKYFGDSWEYAPDKDYPLYSPNHRDIRTVVAVGDLHGMPAPDLGQLIQLQEPDMIVFGGDSVNNKQASHHNDEQVQSVFAADFSPDKPMPSPRMITEEIAAVRALIQWLIDNTNAMIVIMRGTHDNWIWRMLTGLLPVWARAYFADILDVLIFGLPKDRVVLSNQVWTYHYPNGSEELFGETKYLLVLGDAVLSHMNFTSVIPGGAVRKLSDRMAQLYKPLGIADPVLLVQFHGHKVCNYDDRAGHRTCIEPGMGGCAQTEDYKVDYNASWTLGAYGFVRFDQELREGEWHTDLSSVRVIRPRRELGNP